MRVYTQALLAYGLLAAASPASAAYIVDVRQVGNDVIATGSGSLNTSYFNKSSLVSDVPAQIATIYGQISVGLGLTDTYYGYVGGSFGGGPSIEADSSSGASVGLNDNGVLWLPQGYVSGSDLGTSTATFLNTKLSDFAFSSNRIVDSWGSGATADTFTINVDAVSSVPLPASAPLFGAALLAFGVAGYGVKRRGAVSACKG